MEIINVEFQPNSSRSVGNTGRNTLYTFQ